MEFLKRLVVEEEGQGLVEYTLIVLLVALVFWVAVKGTNADQALSNTWNSIVGCLNGGTVRLCWIISICMFYALALGARYGRVLPPRQKRRGMVEFRSN